MSRCRFDHCLKQQAVQRGESSVQQGSTVCLLA